MSQQQSAKRAPQYEINSKSLFQVEEGDKPITCSKQPTQSDKPFVNCSIKQKKDISNKEQTEKIQLVIKQKSQPKKQQKDTSKVKQPLFNFNGVGLFSKESSFGTNLLSKSEDKSGSLVNKSIFNFETKGLPQIKFNADKSDKVFQKNDESSGDEDELQAGQNIEIDKGKSTGKYVYENKNTKILMTKLVKKYKKNNQSVVQKVEVEIVKDTDKNTSWMVVRLPETKNVIMTGYIMKNISSLRHINDKKENIEVVIIEVKSESLNKVTIRLQLDEIKDAQELYKEIQKLI